ncbi:MAG: DUF4386 domain-containing protein [Actinomycetota bacterium]
MRETTVTRWASFVSILQGLLIFIPTFVLGAAIEWPDSLDDPASIALPRLLENEGAVRAGYFAYLIYSILFVVSIALLSDLVFGKNAGILMRIIIALAVASALARSIGIIRWLIPMYDLADLWKVSNTEEQRYTISTTFEALNSYGGTIGEVLGVSIFAAIAILLLSIGNLREKTLPRWFSILGVISALGLLWTSTEILGVDPGDTAIFLGTTVVQIWFLITGLWLSVKSKNLTRS